VSRIQKESRIQQESRLQKESRLQDVFRNKIEQEKTKKTKQEDESINKMNAENKNEETINKLKIYEDLTFVKDYLRTHRINLNIRQVNF